MARLNNASTQYRPIHPRASSALRLVPHNGRASRRPALRGAFSLVELLVVIAVVAMLVGLVLPALAGARNAARSATCAARMTQPSGLLRMYATDHKDQLPRLQDPSYGLAFPSFDPSVPLEKTWVNLLADTGYLEADLETVGLPQTLTCPSAARYENDPTWAGHMPHFGMNFFLSPPLRSEPNLGQRSFFGKPFVYQGDPSHKIMIAESKHLTSERGWFGVGNVAWIATRHGTAPGANVVYLDGHVAFRNVDVAAATSPVADAAVPFAAINFWRQQP